jgi:hypothetical protein
MQTEIGDRVRFKAEGLPDATYQSPAHAELPEDHPDHGGVSWQQHFGGVTGVVTCTDTFNGLAFVRGKDQDGHPYAVWLDDQHLDIVEQGVER